MRYEKQIRKNEKIEMELIESREKLQNLTESYNHLQAVVTSLMHESRRFSSELGLYSEELCKKAGASNDKQTKDLADTIFYTAGLLAARMAFSDFELNPQLISRQARLRTGIYKKFDKACHILTKEARAKGVPIKFVGNSTFEIEALQAFELVPFVILENAVKYSPPDQSVEVNFYEIKHQELDVTINSMGPKLSNDEHARLFERGMRGGNAINSNVSGEGLGLYLAKTLCALNGVKIWVEEPTAHSFILNSVPYSAFKIHLSVKRTKT